MRRGGLLLGGLLLLALACGKKDDLPVKPTGGSGGSPTAGSGGGGSAGDGGSGGEGGSGGAGGTAGSGGTGGEGGGGSGGEGGSGPDMRIANFDHLGGVLPAIPRAALDSPDGSLLLVGHEPVPYDDADAFSPVGPANAAGKHVHGGLQIVDTTRGAVQVLDERDGLPEATYGTSGTGAAPITALAWITPGQVVVAAQGQHLVRFTRAPTGGFDLTSLTLRPPGSSDPATVRALALVGSQLWVGTSAGLVVLDAATLAVDRWVDLAGAPTDVLSLASGSFESGEAVVALTRGEEAQVAVVLLEERRGASVWPLPGGDVPLSLLSVPGSILVGARTATDHGVIHAFVQTVARGVELQAGFIDTERLESAGSPLVPLHLGYDAEGGHIDVAGEDAGSLVELDHDPLQSLGTPARRRFAPEDPYLLLLPDRLELLVEVAGGDLLLAGSRACSAGGRRPVPLLRLRGRGGDTRLTLPFVGSVRSLTSQDDAGVLWLSLRDEGPGLACEGFPVKQFLCRLKADGTCDVFAPFTNRLPRVDPADHVTAAVISPVPAPRQFAMPTEHGPWYVRFSEVARGIAASELPSPFIAPRGTVAAWGEVGQLWMGSAHALGYVELSPSVTVQRAVRYVRAAAPESPTDVPGLPSNTVLDILTLEGGRAVVATGFEREEGGLDRRPAPPQGPDLRGGVALIEAGAVRALEPQGFTPGDVVALARAPGDRLLALDAEAGLLELDLEAGTMSPATAAPWRAPERGLSLAVDAAGKLAVGTTHRLWLDDGTGLAAVSAEVAEGRVWSVAFDASGLLLAGTDTGLVRVALAGDSLPATAGPAGALDRNAWGMPPFCPGVEGCPCSGDVDCARNLACNCDPGGTFCSCGAKQPAACKDEPGGPDCLCPRLRDDYCDEGLECLCDAASCTCRTPVAVCGGGLNCSCEVREDCDPDPELALVCLNTRCWNAECVATCACETETGCPPGFACEDMRCLIPCGEDCSCFTPSKCPDDLRCVQDGDRRYCAK